ncbi:helix-turn-helix domain-containing protein [Streptosporangium sp. NPDC006013]|uniref:helix-turn-helix domain-containing protein n=1 Tax=Streptosporangium sp. NPDC006013 TaxID=3155596 RepID=UPI0033A3AD3B
MVGQNVHRLRTAAGISPADLASVSGISKTTLHGIEQGQGNLALSTLRALATALKASLGGLLETPASTVEVVRVGDRRPQVEGDAVSARPLHRIRLRGTVEVYDIAIAQSTQHSEAHLPGVEECLVLTHGRVTTGPADSPADLAEGARSHLYLGRGPIVVITDNLSSHSSWKVRQWLLRHPRIRQVFIPVKACWPNLAEGWWRLLRKAAFAGQTFTDATATTRLNARAQPWIWGRPPPQPRTLRRMFVYRL